MKTNLIILVAMLLAAPAWAVCSITGGACSPSLGQMKTVGERLVPRDLDSILAPPPLPPVSTVDDLRYYTEVPPANTPPYNVDNQFGEQIGEGGGTTIGQ